MNEFIRIYNFNHNTILQEDFFLNTGINLMYNRRRLFQKTSGKICYNDHFPMNEARVHLNFFCAYMFYSSTLDLEKADYDYDVGFNNFEMNIEEKFVSDAVNRDNIFIILKIDSIPCGILSRLNEQTYLYQKDDVYIIKCTSENLPFIFDKLNNKIRGYLINPIKQKLDFDGFDYSADDLMSIQKLIDCFDVIVLRVPIFSNYNLMFYSSQKDRLDMARDNIISLFYNTSVKILQ